MAIYVCVCVCVFKETSAPFLFVRRGHVKAQLLAILLKSLPFYTRKSTMAVTGHLLEDKSKPYAWAAMITEKNNAMYVKKSSALETTPVPV